MESRTEWVLTLEDAWLDAWLELEWVVLAESWRSTAGRSGASERWTSDSEVHRSRAGGCWMDPEERDEGIERPKEGLRHTLDDQRVIQSDAATSPSVARCFGLKTSMRSSSAINSSDRCVSLCE